MAYYADLEAVLIEFITTIPGVGDVGTDMPHQPVLPFVMVMRVTGHAEYYTDRGVVDVETFATTRAASYTLATTIDTQIVRKLRHSLVGGVPIGRVEPVTAPFWSNYGDELLHRHIASYVIHSFYRAQP